MKNSLAHVNEKIKKELSQEVVKAAIGWSDAIIELSNFPNSDLAISRHIDHSYVLQDAVRTLKDFDE